MNNPSFYLSEGCSVYFETPDDGYSYFFGYYDKSPINQSGTRLICHRVGFDGRPVEEGDVAEVGFFELGDEVDSTVFHRIASTEAWNWQQGSQLQWLGPDFETKIIFNSVALNKYVSVIYDVITGESRTIDFPIYSVHPSGEYALSVRYERHYWCRPGYDYRAIQNERYAVKCAPEDGVFRINLQSGSVEQIISTAQIAVKSGYPSTEQFENWLEHILYSPDGSRFMFFHRWSENNVDMSRVYVADSDTGRNIVGLPNNGFYSHYWWKDNQTLTIWTLPKAQETASVKGISKLKRLRWLTRVLIPVYAVVKPLLGKRVQNAISPQSELRDFCALTGVEQSSRYLVSGNGHQSWFKDNTRLLNDTYQDSDGYRELMILDCEKGDTKQLGKFYSTYNDCVFRCDLHPRLNADDSKVTIDSAHGKKRKVLVLEGI